MDDFTRAIERILAGLEKRNRLLNKKEREIVAYHEMGHAIVSLSLPGSDVIHKVSIIPRGIGALGYTIQRPTEDRFSDDPKQSWRTKFRYCSAGRAAGNAADRVKTRRGLVRYPNFLKIIDFRLDMPIRHGIGVQTAL